MKASSALAIAAALFAALGIAALAGFRLG